MPRTRDGQAPAGHARAGVGNSGRLARLRNVVLLVIALPPALVSALPFGSQEPFWACLWALVLGGAAQLCLTFRFEPEERAILAFFALVSIAFGIVIAAHGGWLQLSPHPVWRGPIESLGDATPPRHGITARYPALEIVYVSLPMLAFIGGLGLARSPFRTKTVLVAALYFGAGIAMFWIFLFVVSPDTVLWREKLGHHGNLTGTFTNRNTAAAYLALFLVTGVLLVCDGLERNFLGRGLSMRSILALLFRSLPRQLAFRLGATFLILLAILLTASRAGLATALVGAGLVAAFRLRAIWSSTKRKLMLAIGFIVLGFALATLFGQSVQQRFAESETVDEDRFEAYRATLTIIQEHPWFGTGPGTFADVFPAYRPITMPARGLWDLAHNTYLQVMVEGGIPLLAVALLPIIYAFILFAAGSFSARSGVMTPILGLGLMIMPMLHALLDFPAQIPGYSILLTTWLGFLFARHVRSDRSERQSVSAGSGDAPPR